MFFNLEPGLRAALGYNSEHDGWRFNAIFEWLPSKGSTTEPTLTQPVGNYLPTSYPQLYWPTSGGGGVFPLNASFNLSVNYYLLDVHLSRGSYMSGRYSFAPFAGIEATWIYFDSKQLFWNDGETPIEMPEGTSWMVRSFTNVWGVGPMLGLDNNYYMGVGFSIYGNGSFAVLFGQTEINYYNGYVTSQTIPGDVKVYDLDNALTLTFRTTIGLQYDFDISSDDKHMRIRAGFDTRYYLEMYPVVDFLAYQRAQNDSGELLATPQIQESGDFGTVGFMQVTSSEKIPGFNKYHSEGLQMCPSFRNVVGVALEGPIYADRVSVRFRAGFDVRYYGNQYSNVNRRASSLLNATTLQLNAEAGEIDVSDLGMVGLLVDLAVDF